MLLLVFVLSSATKDEKVELRIYNDSKFKIEKIKINFKGHEIEFKNIEPKSYSEIKAIGGLWKDNCYDLTISKKSLFTQPFWAHQICFPVDYIGENKIERGKYTLKLKIKKQDKKSFTVETEYIPENKNE